MLGGGGMLEGNVCVICGDGREEGEVVAELMVRLEEWKEMKICMWPIPSLAGVLIFVLQLLLESLTSVS